MTYSKIVLSCALLLCSLLACNAINCYHCQNCAVPTKGACPDDSGSATACYKHWPIGNPKLVELGCGKIEDFNFIPEPEINHCKVYEVKRTESEPKKYQACFCDTDWCNSNFEMGTDSGITPTILYVILTVSLFLITTIICAIRFDLLLDC